MDILRTPDERFENLPGYNYDPHYVEVNGLRMHYIDEGDGDPVLCLHGEPSWCYLYRKMVPKLAEGSRVVCPDLFGFGRSDKPAAKDDYTYELHYNALQTFIESVDLQRATLVCQDWGGLLGLPLAVDNPDRFIRLVIMNTGLPAGEPMGEAFMQWREISSKMTDMPVGNILQGGTVSDLPQDVIDAYNAPFPDGSYKAGAHVFPLLVPVSQDDPAVPYMKRARQRLKEWTKPALVMFSDSDPITAGGDAYFRATIPSAKDEPEITIQDAGHFLQEDKGEEIARHIAEFIERRPVEG